MTQQEVIEKINRCIKKAEIGYQFTASLDPDEDADFVFDEEGTFIIFICKPRTYTPYRAEDFKRIAWGHDRDYEDMNYLVFLFNNGDELQIREDGAYDLFFDGHFYRDISILQKEYDKLKKSE